MPRRAIITATLAALAIAAPAAHATGSPAGSMTVRSCIGSVALAGCTVTPITDSVGHIAVAPDGATVYSAGQNNAGNDIVAAWAVNRATGTMALRNCVSDTFQPPCSIDPDMYQLSVIVASIHGVYVKGSSTIVHIPTLADGSLGAPDSCVSQLGCSQGATYAGLNAMVDIAVTPDGRSLAVAAVNLVHGSFSVFGLDPSTGAIAGRLVCATAEAALPLGCTPMPGLLAVASVAASNSAFYVASTDATYAGVYELGRDSVTGGLSAPVGINSCVQESPAGGLGCSVGGGIDSIFRMSLSPDHHYLLAVAPENATQGFLDRFQLAANAHLAGQTDCLGQTTLSGCLSAPGLAAPNQVVAAPDGDQVYVVSTSNNHDGEISLFAPDTVGVLRPAPFDCIGSTQTLCFGSLGRSFAGLNGIDSVAIDPVDARELFVGGKAPDHAAPDGGLVSLSREVAPTCPPANVTTTVGVPVEIAGCSDVNGDPLTYVTVSPALNGQASPTPGGLLYTPAAGYVGVDSLKFSATDGALQATAATATVTVNKAPPPPPQTTTTTTPTPPPPRGDAKPKISIAKPAAHPTSIHGTASDDHRVAKIQVAVVETLAHHRCRALAASGRLGRRAACPTRRYATASGTTRWSLKLRHRLPAGSYTIYARVTDSAGQTTTAHRSLRIGARR